MLIFKLIQTFDLKIFSLFALIIFAQFKHINGGNEIGKDMGITIKRQYLFLEIF